MLKSIFRDPRTVHNYGFNTPLFLPNQILFMTNNFSASLGKFLDLIYNSGLFQHRLSSYYDYFLTLRGAGTRANQF